MRFEIGPTVEKYFKNLKQVFLYLTDECGLSCAYCLYKPNLLFHLKEKDIPVETAISLVSHFREMGASKLTIMGGEPTLYGASQHWKPLLELIATSKDLGYEYVRLDTNGTFADSLLHKERFRLLDEITFSLDSHVPEINDSLRGRGVFHEAVSNLKLAVQLGYNVDITCCVHKNNIGRGEDGQLLVHEMILFAESLGVSRINFHPILRMGVPRDAWIGNVDIRPDEWLHVHDEIRQSVDSGRYRIVVRIPQRFTTKEDFDKEPEYYGYCPVRLGERALVHPDGMIRVCALMIGTPYGVARFYDNRVVWDETLTNETRNHNLNEITPCPNQRRDFGRLVPLCISFKAKQEEFIWTEKLGWESRRGQDW